MSSDIFMETVYHKTERRATFVKHPDRGSGPPDTGPVRKNTTQSEVMT